MTWKAHGRAEPRSPGHVRIPDRARGGLPRRAELAPGDRHLGGNLVARDDDTRQHRLRRLGVIEATFQPLPIEADVARAFATVAHAVKTLGRQPRSRVMDLWIAPTALAFRLPLYTRNPDDFEGLQDLIEVRVV